MSMPSSSDEVATIAGSRPAFSASSISMRCSRATEPWWARASSSPASSLSAAARRSASRRLLTKMSVERWARISSSSRGWIAGQIEPAGAAARRPLATAGPSALGADGLAQRGTCPRPAPRPAGRTPCRPRRPRSRPARGTPRRASPSPPPRKRATSSSGRWVAESPIRCSGCAAAARPAARARGRGARRAWCPRARGSRPRSPSRPRTGSPAPARSAPGRATPAW